MNKLIVPKEYVADLKSPLIFLAGPIRGAPNWHEEAVKYIFSKEENLYVASPNRIHKEGDVIQSSEFPRQRAWERHYLSIAMKTGCVMFWLPGEENHSCDKVYGAMSRFELGQLSTHYRNDSSTRFCIGSDGRFSEFNTMEYDLKLDAPEKKIHSNLLDTCNEALLIAGFQR